ncbi:Rib/alpha-like domain-containing protein, partial [Peptostreptococcus anaerobius]
MSRTGYCGNVGNLRFRGSVNNIHYDEYKDPYDGFGWSRKPGGNDNYADELIRVNAKYDEKTKTVFWDIIVKGQSAGPLMGATKDLTNPYFTIAISRGLENPKSLYVSNGYRKLKEYPNNWQTQHTGDFRMYDVYKDSDFALFNGRRVLGKTNQTKEFLQEKYRLPCTGKDRESSMSYNIEKYNYYSKYAIIDQQSGFSEANTRMYSFTTKLDEGEVAAQGELPNVASEFTEYMGWGTPRNEVDLSGKVWITIGVSTREFSSNKAKPLGTGNYNFSKIAVVDVKPNEDKLGLEPYYEVGSGKAEDTVKLPVNLKNSKKIPQGTRFMLQSDPKDKFETNPNTGAITQTPADKKDRPISIDQYTGEVTVNIPKGAKGGQEIKDNVQVIYPDGSTHIVPLVVKVIEDKPNIKRGMYATNPVGSEKQLDKESFGDIYMGDDALKYTYQAGDTSKIIKSFTADNLPSGTTFGVGSKASSNNAPNIDHQRLERPLLLKADTKAKVGDFAIKFKAVNGSGKETTATNPGTIKTYLPTNNGTKIRIKKGTTKDKIPSPEAAIGIYHKKYTNPDVIRGELKTGRDPNLVINDKTGYLPDGTTYTWERTPDTDTVTKGSLNYALVKYKNKKGEEIVDKVPVYVEVYDTDDVIVYNPNNVTKPTDDKDRNIPKKDSNNNDIDVNDYNLVAFKTEDKTKGTLTKGKEQNKEVISVLVKKKKFTTFGSIKPTENPATGYTFWFWDKDPANVKKAVNYTDSYASKDVYTAYFIKSGDEIKEVDKNIPLPNGFYKVTIAKGDGIEDNQLFGKTYAVKEGEKLSKDKFPNLTPQASYKEPKWNVDNPWDKAMGKDDVIYTATATQKTTAKKIENLGGIEGKDLAAWVGDKLDSDFWKKGVVAKSTIPDNITKAAVEAAIKSATKAEDITKTARTTNAEVLNPTAGKLKITFADGSSLEVTQKLYVYAKKTTKPIDPNQPRPENAVEVTYNKGDGVNELQGTGKTLVKSGETLADADFPRATLKEGHKDLTWSGQTAGNQKDYKVTAQNKVFTAKATKIEYTTDKIVPWIPADPTNPEKDKPTEGSDKKPIPDTYVTVSFESENEAKGNIKVGAKEGKKVWAKVAPDTLYKDIKDQVKVVGKNGNELKNWTPADKATDTYKMVANDAYTAHFIKNGDIVDKDEVLPTDWYKVTFEGKEGIKSLEGSDQATQKEVYKAYKESVELTKATDFPKATLEPNYKDLSWKQDKTAVGDKVTVTKATTFTATAAKDTTADIVKKNGGLKGVNFAAWLGDLEKLTDTTAKNNFWKKGVAANTTDNEKKATIDAALAEATVEDTTAQKRTTDAKGTFPGTLKVTFKDGSVYVVDASKEDTDSAKTNIAQTLYVKDHVLPTSETNVPVDAIEVEFKLGEGVKVEHKNPNTQQVNTTKGNKETPVLYKSYKVKPGTDLSTYAHPTIHKTIFALINAVPEEGYINPVWNPENKVVTEQNKVFTATATKIDYTTDPVIPFEPANPEKPGDKDDKNIPKENPKDKKPIKRDEYVVVGFKVDPKDSGTLTLGDQANKAVISALVKKGTEWAKFTMPTTNNANDYVFWHWNEAPAGNVADGQVRVAKF